MKEQKINKIKPQPMDPIELRIWILERTVDKMKRASVAQGDNAKEIIKEVIESCSYYTLKESSQRASVIERLCYALGIIE